jgi:two-component system sensor histidine kinase CiaH
MNKQGINRNEQFRFFLLEILGFLVIFSFVGSLIYFVYTSTVYTNSDAGLQKQVNDISNFANQQQRNFGDVPPLIPNRPKLDVQTSGGQDVLFFDSNNQLVNSSNIGDRADIFSGMSFKSEATAAKPLTIKKNGETYRYAFFNLVRPIDSVSGIATKAVAVENFSSELSNINSFKNVLITALLAGMLWTLLISWIITQRLMRPIINSWQQQQDFVDAAAHEIRTPLTIIQNKLENMLRKPTEKVAGVSEDIVTSLSEVRRLSSLTTDMLTLAKTGSNMSRLDPESAPVKKTLNSILQPYREIAKEEEKKLVVHIDTQQEVMNLDVKRLHQLIIILLDNTLKYTKAGDIISFDAKTNRGNLVFQVANDGPAISDAGKKRIFDRFYREEKSGNRQTGGTGLGLSIAQWIVNSYQGKISVSDWNREDPKGVSFDVTLPEIKK